MKYTIVHDMPGRIRLRCGRNAFSLDEGYSITSVLMAQTIVTDAKASSINGSLLIFYIDDSRSLLLDFIDTLVPAELPVIPPAERDTTSEVDAGFQYALAFRDVYKRQTLTSALPWAAASSFLSSFIATLRTFSGISDSSMRFL